MQLPTHTFVLETRDVPHSDHPVAAPAEKEQPIRHQRLDRILVALDSTGYIAGTRQGGGWHHAVKRRRRLPETDKNLSPRTAAPMLRSLHYLKERKFTLLPLSPAAERSCSQSEASRTARRGGPNVALVLSSSWTKALFFQGVLKAPRDTQNKADNPVLYRLHTYSLQPRRTSSTANKRQACCRKPQHRTTRSLPALASNGASAATNARQRTSASDPSAAP